jgi:hypothetical protein
MMSNEKMGAASPEHQSLSSKKRITRLRTALAVGAGLLLLAGTSGLTLVSSKNPKEVAFKKHVVLEEFVAEGVAVGDVNRDGKNDIIAGTYWFEAPNWKRHELAEPKTYDPAKEYSHAFVGQALDVNQDGWVDFIRVGFPGKEVVWYENPKGKPGHWKMHTIFDKAGNESAAFVDVDGDGRVDLLCSDVETGQIVWYKAPVKKGETAWQRFTISAEKAPGTNQFSHGIGLGDINKDGRPDVMVKEGWWEAPQNRQQPNWKFHPANLGEDCAQMHAYDFDGDGDQDVVTSSAHKYGIWWHEQTQDEQGQTHWKQHLITNDISQNHGLSLIDLNRDGHPDLVTGKRYFAHNGKDPGAFDPAALYWFELKPGKNPQWVRHLIDDNSGVGVHVVTQDVTKNGLIDIVVANKKGVFLFEQLKR